MRSTEAWSARVMSDTPDPSPRRNAPNGDVLSGLAAVAPLPLVVLNGSRRLLYVNAAATELFGCNTDQLLGMDLIDHVIAGERSDVASYFRSVLPGPGRRDLEVQRPDGEQRFVHFFHVSFEVAGEALLMGILDDVTEARRVSREAVALADSATRLALTRTLDATLNGLAQSVVQATSAVACGVDHLNRPSEHAALGVEFVGRDLGGLFHERALGIAARRRERANPADLDRVRRPGRCANELRRRDDSRADQHEEFARDMPASFDAHRRPPFSTCVQSARRPSVLPTENAGTIPRISSTQAGFVRQLWQRGRAALVEDGLGARDRATQGSSRACAPRRLPCRRRALPPPSARYHGCE